MSRLSEYTTTRRNADGGRYIPDLGFNNSGSSIGMGIRYRNILVERAWNNFMDPLHRFYVAQFDPIANKLTFQFVERAFAEDFGLYRHVKDDLYGFGEKIPESDRILTRLHQTGAFDYIKKACLYHRIQGYQMTKPEIINVWTQTPNGPVLTPQISFKKCYTDHHIHQLVKNNHGVEQFKRASQEDVEESNARAMRGELVRPLQLNEIMSVHINFIPELSFFRGRTAMHPVQEDWDMSEVFFTWTGVSDEGLGQSCLLPIWDPIIKLMERSDNDHFRQELFTLVELDPTMKGARAQNFMRGFTFALKNKQIFGYHKYLDNEGKPTSLPNIQIQNMVRDNQPTRSQSGGIGALLHSEWSLITANTGYSVSYFMGDPGGAIEAAQADKRSDLMVDIANFNTLARDFVLPFLKLLTRYGVFNDILPPDFNWDEISLKCHWKVDLENRDRALFEASHMASGIPTPLNPNQQKQLGNRVEKEEKEKPLLPERPDNQKKNEVEVEWKEDKVNSETIQEWIKCCIDKHVKDGTMTKEQCIAAAYQKFGKKNMEDVDFEDFEYYPLVDDENDDIDMDLLEKLTDEFLSLEIDMDFDEWLESIEKRENEEKLKKRPSDIVHGKQKPEAQHQKKVVAYVGKLKNLPERTCVKKVKAKIRKMYPDRDNQTIEKQAKKICHGAKPGTRKKEDKKEGSVHVESYSRESGHVESHTRSRPDKPDHPVKVSSYTRDGQEVSGYTRNEIEEAIYLLNGYIITKYNCKMEYLGERLNYEYNVDGYEKDGDVIEMDLDDLNINKMIDPTDPKTLSLINLFKEDWQADKKLPPLMIDEANDIIDGNHRAYVYRMHFVDRVKVQRMKPKEPTGTFSLHTKTNEMMPLIAVTSSMVKGVGLLDEKLVVQFHKSGKQMGSGKTYSYLFESPEAAKAAYVDMVGDGRGIPTASLGGFVWDRLRGKRIGPAWGTGNPTPGGTSASIVPYELQGRSPVPVDMQYGGWEGYDKQAEDNRVFKTTQPLPSGEEIGSKRTYYPEQVGEPRFVPTTQFQKEGAYPWNKPTALAAPGSMELGVPPPLSKKEKKGGEGSVGRPTKGVPYFQWRKEIAKSIPKDLQDLMASLGVNELGQKINEVAKSLGFTEVGDSGYYYGLPVQEKVSEIPEELNMDDIDFYFGSRSNAVKILGGSKTKYYKPIEPFEDIRFNRYTTELQGQDDEYWYVVVNGFSTRNKFKYLVNGRIRVEYQCPDSIKKQVGKEVPLGIYHNLDDKDSVELPDWQVVGTYKIMGYDDEDETDIAYMKINKKRVKEVFEKLKEDDWVTPILERGESPDISTAYPTVVKWNDEYRKFIQKDFDLKSVSIVPQGNCSKPFCMGDQVRTNSMIRKCVMNKIEELSAKLRENGKALDKDEIILLAYSQCSGKKD